MTTFLLIFLLAVAVFSVFVLILTSRSQPSQGAWHPRSRGEAFRDARQGHGNDKAVHAAEELVSELNRLSDRIATSVQDRVSELSTLLDRADERIAELKVSVNQPPTGATETPEENHQPRIWVLEKHKAVYDLADNGLDVYEIARRTNMGAGEIELILSLREKG